ncbi:MAG: hypothetical protein PHX04_05970 [Bacilli bacterium]|jgi:hypothetical protein|nr:hypothetical protein [Bacilli bacterium]
MNNTNIDIGEILEFNVENHEFLEILNGNRPISDIICWHSLGLVLKEMNEKYCAQNCLCESCRSPLEEYTEYDIDGRVSGMHWSCKNGC